ncbi:hypothetical protein [Nonomuraea sp. NPDC050643]|uniref:hypothetical protein n=1 Tax=Nonomuraea sp. NPDC050643 TaxID=3155660 RepID=UPI0033E39DB4
MNDLEERLRAAFDARADTYEASPHAWARTRDRRPRRRPLRFVLAALPVALLAVFVPVLLNGGLGRNTAADPDEVYQRLMRDRTASGEQVIVDNPTEGRPLRLWFAKARLGYPELCFVMERAGAEPYGGCSGVSEELNADAWFTGSTLRDGTETTMDWGVALDDVGGVTGVAADGKRYAGTVLRPAGAPYRIWTVTYPAPRPIPMIEITDDRGRNLGQWSRDMMNIVEGKPDGAAVELPEGVFARLYRSKEGTTLSLTRGGADLGSSPVAGDLPPVHPIMKGSVITGVARKDVARIEFSFGDGLGVGVETRPDPWGLGLTLFSVQNPAGDRRDDYRLVAYDASGAEVWRDDNSASLAPKELPPVGELMTIPGTGESGEPVKAWFTDGTSGVTTLCHSGGVVPEGWAPSCLGGRIGGLFSQKVTTYLPEPGSVTHLGVAGDDWEAVEAVLSDGRHVAASFLRGKDTPARIWYVTVPGGDVVVAGFTLKAKGRPLEHIAEYDKGCARKAARSDAPHQRLPAGITALVGEPGCMAFWQNGKVVPALPGPLPGGRLSDLLGPGQVVRWAQHANAWYGYAPGGTAKVEVVTTNGVTVTADGVPDQWGQGVALFAAPTPAGADFSAGTVVTGYDADGKELWRSDPVPLRNGS